MSSWDGKKGSSSYPHGGGATDSCLIALVLLPVTLLRALLRL